MSIITFLPILDSLLPTAKQIVAANVSNPIELALINGIIDLLKGVSDAYVAAQVKVA